MPRRNSKFMTEPGIAKMAKAPKGKRIERFDSGADGLSLRMTVLAAASAKIFI